MAKWINGVPGVWTRAYRDGWSANVETTKRGHVRAVVLDPSGAVTRSIACADLADAKATAIRYAQEDRLGWKAFDARLTSEVR